MRIISKRVDGSFVADINGAPYHIVADDPLFKDASEAASRLDLPTEATLIQGEVFSDGAIVRLSDKAPASITRRQCARHLFALGMISGSEMVAMTRNGQPPAMVAAMLSALPDEQRWVAEADFAADTYERSNPLLIALMNQNGSTDEEIDQFFRQAGAL